MTGPTLWLDATYLKVRQAGRIVSVAVTVAVNDQGRREVLGMAIGASEAETFWTGFLRSLTRRGRRGVSLPREHRQKLHSTNPLERLNGEIKRRTNDGRAHLHACGEQAHLHASGERGRLFAGLLCAGW